jgi:hypothetical protein
MEAARSSETWHPTPTLHGVKPQKTSMALKTLVLKILQFNSENITRLKVFYFTVPLFLLLKITEHENIVIEPTKSLACL